MVTILANLNTQYDDFDPDELFSFRKAIISLYWKDFEKIIYAEFESLIKNNTWKYQNTLSGQAVLTSR